MTGPIGTIKSLSMQRVQEIARTERDLKRAEAARAEAAKQAEAERRAEADRRAEEARKEAAVSKL